MWNKNLTLKDNAEEVQNIDNECNRLKDLDEKRSDPFQGPIERFQWSMTARYYMCWFTFWEKPELKHFGEPCDNFASCLPDDKELHNYDIRADDSIPFQCASYSFCPNPCCPHKKLLLATDSCQQSDGNPCRHMNNPKCSFNETLNRSFISMVYNEWNVSCVCDTDGYRWNSRYGRCVDFNECRVQKPCDKQTEECVNAAGKFFCRCKLKFMWSEIENKCVEDDLMIRAMKRFSGIDDESLGSKVNYIFYWILGGVIVTICVAAVGIFIYQFYFA